MRLTGKLGPGLGLIASVLVCVAEERSCSAALTSGLKFAKNHSSDIHRYVK